MELFRSEIVKVSNPLSCLILGYDGFDLDVVHNLRSFYSLLGFKVTISRRPIAADILVIHRPPNIPLNLGGYHSVHVFDYVGTPVFNLLPSLPATGRTVWYASTEARAEELATVIVDQPIRIEVLPPPVDVALWSESPTEVEYKYVHIGNAKATYKNGSDAIAASFVRILREKDVHVWGNGWEGIIPRSRLHGVARLRDVSRLYARTEYALGMMYPSQRSRTFSGRFWQAPLNGALLLSESAMWVGRSPGVQPIDYAGGWVPRDDRTVGMRTNMRDMARDWWYEQFQSALRRVQIEIEGGSSTSAVRIPLSNRVWTRAMLTKHRLRRQHGAG